MAPGRVQLFIQRTTMIVRRQTIMTFVIRSTPFCSPMQQVPKPNAVTITIQKVISPGLESMVLNTLPTASVSMPEKVPVAILKKYASIHPPTVV